MSTPLIDQLSLQVFGATGGFILGRNSLGDALSAAGDVAEWVDYLCDATSVQVVRGGTKSGVGVGLQVGTLSFTLKGSGNPLTDLRIRPNTPVRLRTVNSEGPLYELKGGDYVMVAYGSPTKVPNYWRDSEERASWAVEAPAGSFAGSSVAFNPAAGSTEYRWDGSAYVSVPQESPAGFYNWSSGSGSNYFWTGSSGSSVAAPARLRRRIFGFIPGATYRVSVSTYLNTSEGAQYGIVGEVAEPTPFQEVAGTSVSTLDFTATLQAHDLFIELAGGSTQFTSIKVERATYTLYSGHMQDVLMDLSQAGETYVTILGADAMQSHGNITRYGAVVEGGVGYEPWVDRIARLAASAQAPTVVPLDEEVLKYVWDSRASSLDGWRRWGTTPTNVLQEAVRLYSFWQTPGSPRGIYASAWNTKVPVTIASHTRGLERVVTGLIVGRSYTFEATVVRNDLVARPEGEPDQYPDTYALGVVGKSWGTPRELGTMREPQTLSYTFTATATSHTLRTALAESVSRTSVVGSLEAFGLLQVRLVETLDASYRLQDTVYEGPLSKHFDLACDSVGGMWWVDRENVTRFRRGLDVTPLQAHFSDVHMPTSPPPTAALRRNLAHDPRGIGESWSGRGSQDGAYLEYAHAGAGPNGIAGYVSTVQPVDVTKVSAYAPGYSRPAGLTGPASLSASMWVRLTHARTVTLVLLCQEGAPTFYSEQFNSPPVAVNANQWTLITVTGVSERNYIHMSLSPIVYASYVGGLVYPGLFPAGFRVDATQALIEGTDLNHDPASYFDGDTAHLPGSLYQWDGLPHLSESTQVPEADPETWDALHVCYTDVQLAYDTKDVVSQLSVNNHGRVVEGGEAQARDVVYTARDVTSTATWGPRLASTDMTLHDTGAWAGSVATRMTTILAASSSARVAARSVTFAVDSASRYIRFDVHDRVSVEARGNFGTYRVVGVRHDIRPAGWTITLDLMED